MAEKSKSHSELLEEMDAIVRFLLEPIDPQVDRKQKELTVMRKLRNLKLVLDFCNQDNNITFDVQGGILRIELLSQDGGTEVLHEFSIDTLGILDWISDAYTGQDEQGDKIRLLADIFRDAQAGENVAGNLQVVLGEIFEETEKGVQMRPEANVEMTRKRVEQTGRVLTSAEKALISDACDDSNPFSVKGVDWNDPGVMRHFLASVAHNSAVNNANNSRGQHGQAEQLA